MKPRTSGWQLRSRVQAPLLLLLVALGVELLVVPADRSSLLFAAATGNPADEAFSGVLVDLTCATDPKRNLTALRMQHTRKCLLMPVCAESGYALLTEHDQVLRFDSKGNELAHKLIAKHQENGSWKISVKGSVENDHLTVDRIRLLK